MGPGTKSILRLITCTAFRTNVGSDLRLIIVWPETRPDPIPHIHMGRGGRGSSFDVWHRVI